MKRYLNPPTINKSLDYLRYDYSPKSGDGVDRNAAFVDQFASIFIGYFTGDNPGVIDRFQRDFNFNGELPAASKEQLKKRIEDTNGFCGLIGEYICFWLEDSFAKPEEYMKMSPVKQNVREQGIDYVQLKIEEGVARILIISVKTERSSVKSAASECLNEFRDFESGINIGEWKTKILDLARGTRYATMIDNISQQMFLDTHDKCYSAFIVCGNDQLKVRTFRNFAQYIKGGIHRRRGHLIGIANWDIFLKDLRGAIHVRL